MATGFALKRATPADREVLEHLWQLYRHDLSEFRGHHGPDGFRGTLPNERGLYKDSTLVPFLEPHPDRAAYVLSDDGSPVGFAFVSRLQSGPYLMAEFFVVRGDRRRGVARAAVDALFALHPGTWEVPFQELNAAAARFWRAVAVQAGGEAVREERRAVPGKPEVPPDVWLTLDVG
jgi:predicted acetyltransferase